MAHHSGHTISHIIDIQLYRYTITHFCVSFFLLCSLTIDWCLLCCFCWFNLSEIRKKNRKCLLIKWKNVCFNHTYGSLLTDIFQMNVPRTVARPLYLKCIYAVYSIEWWNLKIFFVLFQKQTFMHSMRPLHHHFAFQLIWRSFTIIYNEGST